MEVAHDHMLLSVELPREALRHHPWDPQSIAQQMRVLWLLEQVRERRLGYGKAAELAGLPVAAFLDLMGKHAITPFDYDPAELAKEFRPASGHRHDRHR